MNKDIQYIYDYLKSLTSLLKKTEKEVKALDKTKLEVEKLNETIKEMKDTIKEVQKINKSEDIANISSKLLKNMAKYYIKDDYWYVGNEKLVRATGYSVKGDTGNNGKDGKNGKDGLNGKDGKDGKNGLNGINGKDGKDGKDGINGIDGKLAEIPNVVIGKVRTIQAGEDASVDVHKTKDKIILDFNIPRGVSGKGQKGNDASINGYNTIDIKAGTNVTIDQTDNELTINATGGGTGTSVHSDLTNLDYASAGHTGFEPAKGIDDNYVTNAEKIVIGNTSNINTGDQDLSVKQDTLESGTNIKTINSTSLLGSGNIDTPDTTYTATDFDIKDLTDSTALKTTWNNKQEALVNTTNIKSINGTTLLGSGNITTPNTIYTLPKATTSVLGGVKADGSTITVVDGVISAATGGSGDVTGPSSATDNNIAVFDSVSGKIIKDGGSTISAITSAIPTKTSDLSNDSGFINNTVNDLTNYTKSTDLGAVATSNDYDDLDNKPTIPNAYTLPTSSSTILGGVKVGNRLSITSGVLSADVQTTDISGKEDKSNKVTSISGSSTDTQYPSAKLVYNQLAGKQASGTYSTDIHSNITALNAVSGTNTGDNATNTQYSGLATSKQDTLVNQTNIKSINGNTILGSGDLTVGAAVVKGTCTTARTTAAKVVTISDYTLTAGDILAITFTDGFSVNNATLNVNGSGNINIRVGAVNVTTVLLSVAAATSFTLNMYYDGSYFYIPGSQLNTNTTYTEITETEIDVGTASTARTISGRRAKYMLDKKQDTLVSGTNIKTVNGTALLGSGNIEITGGGEVGLSGTPVDNDFAKFVNGTDIEGRSYAEVRSDLNVADGATKNTNLTSTVLTLGNFTITYNSTDDSLDFAVIS